MTLAVLVWSMSVVIVVTASTIPPSKHHGDNILATIPPSQDTEDYDYNIDINGLPDEPLSKHSTQENDDYHNVTSDDDAPGIEVRGIQENDASREIRCYCNFPICVRTSYMCKSNVLGCFSDLQDSQNFDGGIRGCLNLLPRGKEAMCQNRPGGQGLGTKHSLFLCCHEDMCNHVDSVHRIIRNDTVRRLGDEEEEMSPYKRHHSAPSYSSQEVWFKAATIAVPICGLLILLVLIVLAIKILKTDPQALPPKHWAKDVSAGLLRGGNGCGQNSMAATTIDVSSCCASNKLPLLFKPNDCSSAGAMNQRGRLLLIPTGAVPEKNETQAKLNNNHSGGCATRESVRTPPPPYDVIGLHKATSSLRDAACNLYQPLLDPPPPVSPDPPRNLSLLQNRNVFKNADEWGLAKNT